MNAEQIGMFDGSKPYKIRKPIRLIELFAGIGAQAKALERLGIPFEHYRICEFDKYAVQSYNAVHGTQFETSDITKIKAADLGITETDKYEYIMTYSFPCQDLSIAGKQSGMAKGSGTRSGLLWEVERLLDECSDLPQVLLMENVPDVIGTKNIKHFANWIKKLETLGYHNYWKLLNAKDYGIPQNRNRTFMVSLLGDYYYDFPQSIPLKLRLKDMLEKEVDEKYYLRAEQLGNIKLEPKENQIAYPIASREFAAQGWKDISPTIYARDYKDPKIIAEKCQVVGNLNIPGRLESACRVHGINGIAPTCNTCGGGGHETKIAEPIIVDDIYNNREPREYGDTAPTLRSERQGLKVVENYRIRKLTPKECWRLMGFTDSDFDKAKSAGVSNSQLYKQAGNSIVVNVLEAIFKQMTAKVEV